MMTRQMIDLILDRKDKKADDTRQDIIRLLFSSTRLGQKL